MSEKSLARKIGIILLEIIIAAAVAVNIVVCAEAFYLVKVGVSGGSMLPTINDDGNSTVMVQQNWYKLERGDIIVFYRSQQTDEETIRNNPANVSNGQKYLETLEKQMGRLFKTTTSHSTETTKDGYTIIIKRVIGLAGDVVRITNGQLYIQYGGEGEFELQNEPYINGNMTAALTDSAGIKRNGYGVADGEWTVGEEQLFVMGDNRNLSIDSEDYGPISTLQVWGKVVILTQNNKNTIMQ